MQQVGGGPFKGFRDSEVFIYIAIDEDGDEAVPAFRAADGAWMPMVMADKARVKSLKPVAERMRREGVTLKLIRLSTREDVDEAKFFAEEGG